MQPLDSVYRNEVAKDIKNGWAHKAQTKPACDGQQRRKVRDVDRVTLNPVIVFHPKN